MKQGGRTPFFFMQISGACLVSRKRGHMSCEKRLFLDRRPVMALGQRDRLICGSVHQWKGKLIMVCSRFEKEISGGGK